VPPPAAAAASPIDQLNEALSHFECAALHSRVPAPGAPPIIKGTIPDPDEKAWLSAIAQRYFPDTQPQIEVDIVPAPLCRSLGELATMRRFGLLSERDLSLRLVSPMPQLREGDLIKVEVHAPAYPVSLRIDYYSLEGQVQHLWPNDQEKDPKLAPDAVRIFGEPGGGRVWKAGGAPFGTEMITVLATPVPLNLGQRPWVEQSQDYLRDLKRALDTNRSDKTAIYQTLLVTTRRR
jgi:eukaryotic-like serine/threonine-protein kinase